VTRARAARRTGSTRDRALLTLPYGTGLRLAEATALDVDDVPTTERTGAVHVRAGQGERPRTVPLPADARNLLRRWLTERANHPAAQRGEPALWLEPRRLDGAGGGPGRGPGRLRRAAADPGAGLGPGAPRHADRPGQPRLLDPTGGRTIMTDFGHWAAGSRRCAKDLGE
jgi:integrase